MLLKKTVKQKYRILNKKILLVLYAVLVFIHFVVKDSISPFHILYYAFPPLLLIIGSLFLSVLFFSVKKVFYPMIVCFLFLLLYWFSYYYNGQPSLNNLNTTSSILFWNVGRKGGESMDIIIKKVKEQKISFIALVEAEEMTDVDLGRFKKTFPGYSIQKLQGDMVLAVKGKIKDVSYYCQDLSYKFNYVTVILDHQKNSILIADVNAVPFNNRESALHTIYEFTKKNNCSFIAGDFNTPYESVHFNDYRNNLNSFHSVSKGFTATWLYGIPLFEIDQIWSAKKITPVVLEKEFYKVSDHALLIGAYK
ncbi:endonuclease/exonuclease/phosphatase family protein [Aquimarina muelleri]|uniref:Endonuclease/exonuclease/phosphatase domain-containing protein n=1 Tax=Aquimarina muelleri TaxID=279356 RepID=A0A918JWQ1_9FLAO|nr:endonuclease/exonuclease/phosphatase family protein [Aquimarina muelleri]MCX2762464.1 endonuclease/exonuclease/phosphatase family protein [Aquimarina muelleri]GGX20659.1 hypothetical protein GCM10007384_22530 [Aquimarina muelleri]